MSKVTMTVKQIMDLGLWDKVCEYKNWDVWILNEGKIDSSEEVEFDTEFKKEQSKYAEAVPILKDEMKLYSYNIKCSPRWEGEFYGIVFAKDGIEAIQKVEIRYTYEENLEITLEDINPIDFNKFENDCFEVGNHRE